jgi:hypothetical protein
MRKNNFCLDLHFGQSQSLEQETEARGSMPLTPKPVTVPEPYGWLHQRHRLRIIRRNVILRYSSRSFFQSAASPKFVRIFAVSLICNARFFEIGDYDS